MRFFLCHTLCNQMSFTESSRKPLKTFDPKKIKDEKKPSSFLSVLQIDKIIQK